MSDMSSTDRRDAGVPLELIFRSTDGDAGASGDGRIYWRSMQQLAGTPEFEQFLHREFQDDPDQPPTDAVSRRRFLSVVAAAVALASTTSCRKPFRKILPYSQRPEDMTDGVPRYYATALGLDGYGTGVLVRSSDGRPTKVEGNPLHPASMGGTSALLQGELLNLYDPARSRHPRADGARAERDAFASFWKTEAQRLGDGSKLAFLVGHTTSPSFHYMVEQVKQLFPAAAFHVYRPINRDTEVAGAQLAFGRPVDAQYRFDAADVVVSLDSDFLVDGANCVRHARDYASRRRPLDGQKLNRLYVVEPGQSITGGQADHRFRVRAQEVADVALALAAELGVLNGALGTAVGGYKQHSFSKKGKNWVAILAKDLLANRGRSLLIAGRRQPALVHALVHALNDALGNTGRTVTYTASQLLVPNQLASLQELTEAMDHQRVETLFILGGNPVYDAPADLEFGAKLQKVKNRVHLGLHWDETGRACNWHLNAAHELEAWGDSRAYDGTVSMVQPLIAPLYDGMSELELLALVSDYDQKEGYGVVRYYWEDHVETEAFDAWWNRALHDGLVHQSTPAPERVTVQEGPLAAEVAAHKKATPATRENLEVTFQPGYSLYDGRYANNSWMQECPDPVTKLTWDNAAVLSLKTAEELGIENGDVLELSFGGRSVEIPAWIVPGHADYTVALTLGYGRDLGEEHEVARGAGFDVYKLRVAASPHMGIGLKVRKAGRRYDLQTTQDHWSLRGRNLYRRGDLAQFEANPTFAPDMSALAQAAKLEGQTEKDKLKSLWEERKYDAPYQWGMVIDLNSCNGCNACVVACQSENNVPSVGKSQIAFGREMHWLRVDRYFTTPDNGRSLDEHARSVDEEELDMVQQPVPCMQCENAPCESVCPVAATTHSPEGLNDMAYNRCIGTRYCNNNCPYKVRRFNFFDFFGKLDPTLQMVKNPDVTIRSRGVMEKCTYCVQRINGGKRAARKEDRLVLDGEIVPACAQSCPSQAITFGNIADPNSRVSKLRNSPLNYAMLSELNVKPRTTYLAKIRNPNPELS
jgi:molybdopterin-containing oxidoreductase family iron-sulfur binding subunit